MKSGWIDVSLNKKRKLY